MCRWAVLTSRGAAMSLMLAAMAVGLMACSDSATQATKGESEPVLMQDATADKPDSFGGNSQTRSQSAQPTAAVVPVVSVAASTSEGRAQSHFNPASPAATATPGKTPSGDADITPEQIVAAFEEVLYGIYEEALPAVVYIQVPNSGRRSFQGNAGASRLSPVERRFRFRVGRRRPHSNQPSRS